MFVQVGVCLSAGGCLGVDDGVCVSVGVGAGCAYIIDLDNEFCRILCHMCVCIEAYQKC